MIGKYGQEQAGWCTKEVRERYGVGVWMAIRGSSEAFKNKTSFEVGSENKVKFWKDKWCGDMPLRNSFLDPYSIGSSKDVWVVGA